jgi:hypothetical protein
MPLVASASKAACSSRIVLGVRTTARVLKSPHKFLAIDKLLYWTQPANQRQVVGMRPVIGARAAGGDASVHDRMESSRTNYAHFKWIHVQVADHNGPLVGDPGFGLPNRGRNADRPKNLILRLLSELTGRMLKKSPPLLIMNTD